MILSCSHKCVKSLAESEKGSIQCPECRAVTKLGREGVKRLKINLALRNVISKLDQVFQTRSHTQNSPHHLQVQVKTIKSCSRCEKSPTLQCDECDDIYCDSCSETMHAAGKTLSKSKYPDTIPQESGNRTPSRLWVHLLPFKNSTALIIPSSSSMSVPRTILSSARAACW